MDPILRRRPELLDGLARLMAARQQSNEAATADPAAPCGAAGRTAPQEMMGRLRAFFGL